MSRVIKPYPLQWPDGWARTNPMERRRSRFSTTPAAAWDNLETEIFRLGAVDWVASANQPMLMNGRRSATAGRVDDPGVAAYWRQPTGTGYVERVIACDRWDRLHDNVHAISLSIGALRGLDRWGATDLVDKAFEGFKMLPPAKRAWFEVLGVQPDAPLSVVEAAYKALAKERHPDHGGEVAAFRELSEAIAEARKEAAR